LGANPDITMDNIRTLVMRVLAMAGHKPADLDTMVRSVWDILKSKGKVNEDLVDVNDEPTVPGWYLVDTHNGNICDGPFETSRQASERKAYPTETPQFWSGSEWTEDDISRRLAQLAGVNRY